MRNRIVINALSVDSGDGGLITQYAPILEAIPSTYRNDCALLFSNIKPLSNVDLVTPQDLIDQWGCANAGNFFRLSDVGRGNPKVLSFQTECFPPTRVISRLSALINRTIGMWSWYSDVDEHFAFLVNPNTRQQSFHRNNAYRIPTRVFSAMQDMIGLFMRDGDTEPENIRTNADF